VAANILSIRKAKISQVSGGLRIVIPGWLNWPVLAFILLWLSFWVEIMRSLLAGLLRGQPNWVELLFWGSHGPIASGFLLWLLAGREVVFINGVALTLQYEILGLGWSRKFTIAEIRDLNVFSQLDLASLGKWNPSFLNTSIVFHHGGKVFRFGRGLEYAEAKRVVEAIQQWYPSISG